MFLASGIIVCSAVITGNSKCDKMDGWLIGTIGALIAGAVLHIL